MQSNKNTLNHQTHSASLLANRNMGSRSSADGTMRMPRPPPPMAAFTITGYVIGLDGSVIHASASAGVENASSDPTMTGTFALMASWKVERKKKKIDEIWILYEERIHNTNRHHIFGW